MKRENVLVKAMAVILVAGALLVVPEAVHGQATITVNSTAQEVTLANPNGLTNLNCTLGEAVLAAKTNAVVDTCTAGQTGGTDTIMIPAGTYTFTEAGADPLNNGNPFALPEPGEPATLQGAGAGTTILERSSAPATPTFYFLMMGISVSLNDLTVRNFGGPDVHGLGAAIKVLNAPTLSLSNFVLEDTNVNSGDNGAGISISQFCITLNITNSTFRNNVNASGARDGGAIAACGAITISNSSFVDNRATAGGGALYFRNEGGGNAGTATVTISNTVFSGNTAGPDNGSGGGAIRANASGTLSISQSLFLANVGHVDQSAGGAIENNTMTMTITDSAFLNNSARNGGAIHSGGPLTVRNSTFSGNSSCCNGGAMRLNVPADIENVTMVGNSTTGGGGGIFLESASANIRNSIVAGNSPGGNFSSPFGGGPGFHEFFSQGHNVLGETDGVFFNAGTGDQIGTGASPLDAMAQSPADNGSTVMAGSTVGGQTPQVVQTMALFSGSPALEGGDPGTPGTGSPTCEATDARGILRPQPAGGVCDTGAFEDLTGNGIPSGLVNLAVSKLASPEPVLVGANLTYTITIANNGPDPATNVVLNETLDAAVAFVSVLASQGSCDTSGLPAISCSLGGLANTAQATVTIVVTAPATAQTVQNNASVSATETDPDPTDNVAVVVSTVVDVQADLSVTKTDAPDPQGVGGNITYTVVVANAGPDPATNVSLTDTLSGAATTFVSVTSTGNTCSSAGFPTITCDMGTIASGANETVTIVVTATATGTITNAASVTATEADPIPANNTDIESTTVAVPGFTLSVSPPSATILPGQSATFTVTVTPTPFVATVDLACSGAPPLGTCSFNPTTVNPGNLPATSILTVTTTGLFTAQHRAPKRMAPVYAFFLPLSAGLGLTGLVLVNARRRCGGKKWHGLVLGLLSLVLVASLIAGCAFGRDQEEEGTPAGTYPVTITVTGGGSTQTVPVNIVVQGSN